MLTAADAKALAQQMLARTWAQRDALHLRLPPARLGLEPGSRIDLPLSPSRWTVQNVTIDGFVVAIDVKPSAGVTIVVPADSGRSVADNDLVAAPVSIALLDIPTLSPNSSTLLLAASSPTAGWKRALVDVSVAGQNITPFRPLPGRAFLATQLPCCRRPTPR